MSPLRGIQIKVTKQTYFREVEYKLMKEHGCHWPNTMTAMRFEKGDVIYPIYLLVSPLGLLSISKEARPEAPFYELEIVKSPERIVIGDKAYSTEFLSSLISQHEGKLPLS